MDDFYQQQWENLSKRVKATAEHFGGEDRLTKAEQFTQQDPPSSYKELLQRHRKAAELAVSWQEEAQPNESEAVDSASSDDSS